MLIDFFEYIAAIRLYCWFLSAVVLLKVSARNAIAYSNTGLELCIQSYSNFIILCELYLFLDYSIFLSNCLVQLGFSLYVCLH